MAADTPSDDSGFTHAEVRQIFQRAGQLDALSDRERRMSLAEVQRIAAEAGLDPVNVARAAESLRSGQLGLTRSGRPARFHGAITIPRRVGEEEIAAIVGVLRSETGHHGGLLLTPLGTEWRLRSSLGAVIASIRSTAEKTQIDFLVARDDARGVTWIASGTAGILLGIAAGLLASRWLGAPIAVGVATGLAAAATSTWALATALWKPMSVRWARRTQALVDAVRRALPETPDVGD